MKHASARALFAVALGIAVAREWPWIVLPALLAAVGAFIVMKWTRGWSLYVVLATGAALFYSARAPTDPPTELFTVSRFRGTVVREVYSRGQQRFTVELERPWRGRVLVSVRERTTSIGYGDLVEIRSRIRPFDYPRNPGVTDYNRVLRDRGYVGRTSPRSGQIAVVQRGRGALLMRSLVMPIRRYVARAVDRFLPGVHGDLLTGLLLGDKERLSRDVQDAFVDAGVVHVLAISGMHVGVVIGVFWLLLSVLRVRGWLRFAIATAGVVVYVTMVGNSPATVRAGLMAVMAMLSLPTQRRFTPVSGVCVAGLLLLLIDPTTLFDPGAQLSFAATMAICLIAPRAEEWTARWKVNRWIRTCVVRPAVVSMAATGGTVPLLLHHFGRVPLLGFVASIPAVLVVSLAIPFGFLMVTLNLVSSALAGLAGETLRLCLSLLLAITRFFGGIDWAVWQPGKLTWPWVMWLYSLVLLAVVRNKPAAQTMLRVVLAGGLAVAMWSSALRHPQFEAAFLDPGRGDAILMMDTLGRCVLVDAGIDGSGALRDFLRGRGLRHIDIAVVTHPDRDHYGGLLDLDMACGIDWLIVPTRQGDSLYRALLERYGRRGTRVVIAGAGTRVSGLGYGLEFVWPEPVARRLADAQFVPANTISLVALIEYRGFRMLFTGDLDEPAVFAGLGIHADLLKSPHHGSRKGNTDLLFDAVNPSYVVVMGRYPTPARLEERFVRNGVCYINTRRDGGCLMSFCGNQPRFHWTSVRSPFNTAAAASGSCFSWPIGGGLLGAQGCR